MRRMSPASCALLIFASIVLQTASAQLPVKIKIPKAGRPKTQPSPTPNTTTNTTASPDAQPEGSRRIIVPVQIIGDQDGAWDRAAWKTAAFYGNPLTGFTPAQ